MKYRVVEKFVSINGEGTKAGQLAVFVRFAGCNLRCDYCDTKWAYMADVAYVEMSGEEILEYIKSCGVKNVTLTGGEPLIQAGIRSLLELLAEDEELFVEIETNGSIDIGPYDDMHRRPAMTLDYKLPGSGVAASAMKVENYAHLRAYDTVKFVASSIEDLDVARELIDTYGLAEKCHVYLSPVFGKIAPADMVEYMKDNHMNGVNLQLQLHKFIWDPDKKGV